MDEKDRKEVSNLILKRLNEMGKSQAWLASRIGITRQQVNKAIKLEGSLTIASANALLNPLGLQMKSSLTFESFDHEENN